jgi:hypothetical protein
MFAPSFYDHLEDRLNLAVYDTNQEHRAMKRRLLEAAFINGEMREPGYIFEDNSEGPHRRNDSHSFAYHAQFEEIKDEIRLAKSMSIIDRIKAKALQARSIAPDAIRAFEADLDALIAEGPKLKAAKDEAVNEHKQAFAGVYSEVDGLKSAIDILSNGPLGESKS